MVASDTISTIAQITRSHALHQCCAGGVSEVGKAARLTVFCGGAVTGGAQGLTLLTEECALGDGGREGGSEGGERGGEVAQRTG